MPQTRFSVVITCYNHAGYIGDAVGSALGQSWAPSQIMVVDDASTDTSVEVLRRYGNAITLIAHSENQGISRARNAGTAPACGDYLVFLDGDHILKPWALAAYEQIVRTRRAAIILASLSWFAGAPPNCTEQDFPGSIDFVEYKRLAEKDRSSRSSASAIVVERQKVLAVDGWTESIAFMQDHDLLAKLAETGPAIQILSPATVFYRSHASNNYKDTGRLLKDCYNLIDAWRRAPKAKLLHVTWSAAPCSSCCGVPVLQTSIGKPLACLLTAGSSSGQPPSLACERSSSAAILPGLSLWTSNRSTILRPQPRVNARCNEICGLILAALAASAQTAEGASSLSGSRPFFRFIEDLASAT